jgi:hypothetical protein
LRIDWVGGLVPAETVCSAGSVLILSFSLYRIVRDEAAGQCKIMMRSGKVHDLLCLCGVIRLMLDMDGACSMFRVARNSQAYDLFGSDETILEICTNTRKFVFILSARIRK